jgi:hypothetical protein
LARVLPDRNRGEVRADGNLLIEAVELLVQRQRETESWLTEQIWQAEERATATERVAADLEARLAAIEQRLARLGDDVDPPRDHPGLDERLARLREQVEGLKSGADRRVPPRTPPVLAGGPGPTPPPVARPPRTAPNPAQGSPAVGFWALFGSSPQDRFGLVLMAAGGLAVLYALLSQLRAG